MRLIRSSNRKLEQLTCRVPAPNRRVERAVRTILENVRHNGDAAVLRYGKKFDGVRLNLKQLRVSEAEISEAFNDVPASFLAGLKQAIDEVTQFHRHQMKQTKRRLIRLDGTTVQEIYQPLERAGVYVPAGTHPLVSTVYMTVIPAKVAGVKKIILATPPNAGKRVNPYILVVASLLKVDEIYKIGGAHAVAAMAFGTKTIPKVDAIAGPGNPYVTEAKRQLFGYCNIDLLAGPSEVVVIANKFSNPEMVLADLRAQAEHPNGLAILVTTSKKLAKIARDQGPEKGYCILVSDIQEGFKIANQIAPEHLHVMAKCSQKMLSEINHAGAIFVGPFSPVAVGDYMSGPSHVLPTGGSARFFSGLGVENFLRRSHIIHLSRRALERVKGPIEELTKVEGLNQHFESIQIRFKSNEAQTYGAKRT